MDKLVLTFLPKITLFNISILTLLLIFSQKMMAGEHAPHVHGKAELTIALENNSIEVHFLVPAESLLGFEHSAKSDQDIAKVQGMKKWLSTPEQVIRFKGNQCKVAEVNLDTGHLLASFNTKNMSEHAHSHAEIDINYKFECKDGHEIKSASVVMFNQYPAIEKIKTFWVTEQNQGATELNKINREVHFQ